MPTRLLLAVTALAAAAGTAAPASASLVCAATNVTKDRPIMVCVPWGSPLPPLGCPVQVVDVLVVCERPY